MSTIIGVDGTEETARRTYKFEDISGEIYAPYEFYNLAGTKLSQQIIKNGDELEPIAEPYHAGYVFEGWYLWDEEAGDFGDEVEFETAINDVDETEDVIVRAKYENVKFVKFHEEAEGTDPDIIQTTKITDTEGNVIIGDVIAPQPGEGSIFYGWALGDTQYPIYDDGTLIKDTSINVKDEDGLYVNLYPYYVEAYWLRFVSGGTRATYIPSQFVQATDTVTELDIPTRKGYTFAGWYTGSQDSETGVITYDTQITDATGKVIVEGGLKLTEDTTLYGNWTPNSDSKYTVVIWRQKVTDKKDAANAEKTYDYVESIVRTGVTDAEVSASDADKSHSGGDYTGFHFSRTVQNSTTILADGSTVIDVYYDRDLMAINFYYTRDDAPEGAETAYNYTRTTSDSGTQYGILEDGSYVLLTRENGETVTTVYYTYNPPMGGQRRYTGTFYVQSGYSYIASQYSGSNLPPEDDTTKYYALHEGMFGDYYRELTRRTESSTTYMWTYTKDGVTYNYTGTRFTRSQNGSYPYMVTFTGLYGQSFAQNGYSWPSGYQWFETASGQGTVQTFLTDFTQTQNPYNLYDRGTPGNNTIYHYKQGLDGKYAQTAELRFVAKSSGGTFNVSKKFEGFKVTSYDSQFRADGGRNDTYAGDQITNPSDPLHIYHERNKWNIDYQSEGEIKYTEKNIYFEASLEDYNYNPEDIGIPAREHYKFTGWYADETCTQLFDFSSTMPNANVVVYAGWEQVWYQIIVDPDGGEILSDHGQATYFWKKYEETFDAYTIKREYFPDASGTYKYVYVAGEDDPDGNIPSVQRTATYETAESDYTGQKYRKKTADDPDWVFIGWYVVDENDETTNTPYDFAAEVTAPVKIRAVWRLSGAYKLQYIATADTEDAEGQTVTVSSSTFVQEDPDADYADGAEVILQAGPKDLTPPNKFLFDGWEVVNEKGDVLDDNDGAYYQPGDTITLDVAAWASKKLIRLRAHYSPIDSSDLPVSITKIIFDANGGKFENVEPSAADAVPLIEVTDTQVSISKLNINEAWEPVYGSDNCVRDEYVLVGWAFTKDATEAVFVPGEVIGADELDREGGNTKANTLYAVWAKTYKLTVKKVLAGSIEFIDLPEGYDIDVTITGTKEQIDVFIDQNEDAEKISDTEATITLTLNTTKAGAGNAAAQDLVLLEGTEYEVKEQEDKYKELFESIDYENEKSGDSGITKNTTATVTNTAKTIAKTGLDLDTTAAKTALLSLFAFAMMCVLGFSLKRKYASRR